MAETMYWGAFQYRTWTLFLTASDRGLCLATLPNETFQSVADWTKKHSPHGKLVHDQTKITPYAMQLKEYLERKRFAWDVPLDLRGTAFQIAVWNELQRIPFGETRSYSEVAAAIGKPGAIRAVGMAVGSNPVPVFIPCHRVIGKNGSLTGYRGGLEMKRELLQLEKGLSTPRP